MAGWLLHLDHGHHRPYQQWVRLLAKTLLVIKNRWWARWYVTSGFSLIFLMEWDQTYWPMFFKSMYHQFGMNWKSCTSVFIFCRWKCLNTVWNCILQCCATFISYVILYCVILSTWQLCVILPCRQSHPHHNTVVLPFTDVVCIYVLLSCAYHTVKSYITKYIVNYDLNLTNKI